jgi:hypothetical protein
MKIYACIDPTAPHETDRPIGAHEYVWRLNNAYGVAYCPIKCARVPLSFVLQQFVESIAELEARTAR